jgi:RNA polymerase sigma-70 factor, ECF subfamily
MHASRGEHLTLSGDGDGFEEFVRNVSARLTSRACFLTGNVQEAQDLVQETFIRAWRHWSEVALYDDPEAWVRRVMLNLARSRWRRSSRRNLDVQAAAVQVAPDIAHLDLMKAMARLPFNHRQAIVLHDLFGLTVPEIAADIAAPEGSIRTWLHRGRAALRKSLDLTDSPTHAKTERREDD